MLFVTTNVDGGVVGKRPKNSRCTIVLRELPREEAFYFFSDVGNYTGESAASLEEFVKKIREVDNKSLEFHLYRGDFEKWVGQVLADKRLAEEIRNLRNVNVAGDALRARLYSVVSKRHMELKRGLFDKTS